MKQKTKFRKQFYTNPSFVPQFTGEWNQLFDQISHFETESTFRVVMSFAYEFENFIDGPVTRYGYVEHAKLPF